MRICLYTETALPQNGRQEQVVDALARQFSADGHDAVVLTQKPRPPLRADDRRLPYPVVRHSQFIFTGRLMGWHRRSLIKLYQKQPFDVLHCHSVFPCGYLAALSRSKLGIPTVITSHGRDLEIIESKARSARRDRQRLALEAADALVATSRVTVDDYRRLCPKARNIVRIPNGIDREPFTESVSRPTGLDPAILEGRYLLFLGQLNRQQGVDVLLKALARIPADSPHVQLVVAGDGEERPALVALAEQLGLSSRLRFVGPAQGTLKSYLLQNALSLVFPSRQSESFEQIVLEGYAAGCPAVASDVPGLADLIQPEKTGYLALAESPERLAAVIKQVLSDPTRARVMGERARRVVEEYSWPAVAGQYVALFERLISHHQRAAA